VAADPRVGGPAVRKLSVQETRFYAEIYSSARKGSLAELRRKGCSEEEAEEFFSTAFQRVMESVDPIAREFAAPQMVNFVKRAAWRCMIDERRRRGLRPEVELGEVHSLSDKSAESPEEVAEEREAVAIGREALQMLSERDRLIFRQRHQMNLTPEEILQNMPGLSMRTYRKIIQRANTRVLDAYERIEGGERCEEMEEALLRRYVADESPEAERLEVSAHLAHCRSCRQAQARMRGYLFDVASVLVATSSMASSRRLGAAADVPARLADLASSGTQGLVDASRILRERIREMLVRTVGGMPGSAGDATVGQALTATSVKVASVCAAGVAAGACVAAGVVPGVGGLGLLSQGDNRPNRPPERPAKTAPVAKRPSLIDTLPAAASPDPPTEESKPKSSRAGREGSRATEVQSATPAARAAPPVASSPSEAEESDSVTGSEFGAESTQPVAPPPPAPSTTPSTPSSSGGGRSSGAAPQGGGGSEFGL
jgi:RNA polymerase sigma factor (sigma-70 family)